MKSQYQVYFGGGGVLIDDKLSFWLAVSAKKLLNLDFWAQYVSSEYTFHLSVFNIL